MTAVNINGGGDKSFMAFTPLADSGDTLTYSDASARKALPLNPADYPNNNLWCFNRGTGPVYVLLGDETVVSTLNQMSIPPNQGIMLTIATGVTYIAAIAPSGGSGELDFIMGVGHP